jgi:DNA recombination protein RmuC
MAAIFLILGLLVGAAAVYLWARAAIAGERAQRQTLETTRGEWEERMRSATGEQLLKSQSSLLELTEAKLAPIKETLTKFEQQTRQLEEKRTREVTAIGERLREVAEGQERLRTETGSLVTALRAPHVRGRWGEIQLKRGGELAGMLEHCDFRLQASVRDDDGGLLRPDMVVDLPGGKTIVVDSKVPIQAYLDAVNTDDPDAKRAHLVRHAQQVRDHVKKLGQKRYWDQFESTPEFVVMFVDEGLYRAALDQDGSLLEAGSDAGVVIASPATLIGLLRTVAYGWQQETVAQNAREIRALGSDLYKRLGTFAKHLDSVGNGLNTAVGAYNRAVSSFETRLLVTARKFPEHGVTNDELPETKQLDVRATAVDAPELIALPPADAA